MVELHARTVVEAVGLGVAVDYVNALGRLEERYYQSGAPLAQAIDARGPNWVWVWPWGG